MPLMQASPFAAQADVGLPVDPKAPLFAFIGRLEEQKGVDILMAALPKLLAKAPNAQVVILGTGKAKFEKQVAAIDKEFKGRAKGVVKFSAPLAHLMTAGADFILVPSRFEPCGLIQLHAMQYGTVPVVASTGGLVDTVKVGWLVGRLGGGCRGCWRLGGWGWGEGVVGWGLGLWAVGGWVCWCVRAVWELVGEVLTRYANGEGGGYAASACGRRLSGPLSSVCMLVCASAGGRDRLPHGRPGQGRPGGC